MHSLAAICLNRAVFATAARRVVRRLAGTAIGLTLLFGLGAGAACATPGIPGTLDPFFATGSALGPGKFLQSMTAGSDYVSTLLLQPDGRLLLTGACNGHFCALRLNPDGTLDTTFNATGMVLLAAISNGLDDATGAVIQPDGKLVIVGYCTAPFGYDMCVARLNADGSTDATFAAGTKPVTGAGQAGGAYASAVAVQTDGKLVLAGWCFSIVGNLDFCVERLNADGSVDTTFNASGTPGRVLRPVGASYDYGFRLLIQPDGKAVVAGRCTGAGYDFCAMRLNPDGSLDTGFNGTGTLLQPVGTGDDSAVALALQPDGKLILAGNCINGATYDFCAARLNADGSLDTTFNSTGTLLLPVGTGNDYATAVALQSDGKLLLSGYCANTANTNFDFCAVRLNSDGSLDKTFNPGGTPGKVTYAIAAGNDMAMGIAVQPDGKIVVAGYCGPDTSGANLDFCAIRLEGGPYGAQQCRMDIDGDGKVLATTDALIQTRIALGLRGSAVTNGISFPVGATRTSWTAIRNYLVTQCGMEL